MVSWRLVPLLLALLAVLPQSALALTATHVYEQVKDSVVVIRAYDLKGQQVGLGSGVKLPSGDIITNYHVVKAGTRYTVDRGKQTAYAFFKAGDSDMDLCLLTAPGLAAKPARLGKAAKLKVGEPVYAVGAPQGLELSLSEGIVSQLRGAPHPIIQTTVAISPGSSGGGLFNAEGELVGITTFYLKDSQSLNFALPVEWVGEVAKKKDLGQEGIVNGRAPGAPVPGARPKEGWKDRAEALGKAQDWPGLLTLYRRWTQAEPGNYLAWSGLGFAYAMLDRYKEAIEAYRESLRLKPDAYTWLNLGVTYLKMGRPREAIEATREALRLKPDSAEFWHNLGVAYASLDRHVEAIEAIREALRLNPNYGIAWSALGRNYGNLGRHKEAIEAYREALRLKAAYVEAYSGLALSYAQLGNRSAALEALKELRRYDPQQAEKLFNFIMKP
jgi:Flp pilus assembly protein TadD